MGQGFWFEGGTVHGDGVLQAHVHVIEVWAPVGGWQ